MIVIKGSVKATQSDRNHDKPESYFVAMVDEFQFLLTGTTSHSSAVLMPPAQAAQAAQLETPLPRLALGLQLSHNDVRV